MDNQDLLYLLPFFIALYIRLTTLNPYNALPGYFDAIVFIPFILLITYLYFNYHFYENIFVFLRYESIETCQKIHMYSNIKEALLYGGWLSLLGIIIGIKYLSLEEIISLFIISLIIITTLFFFVSIYNTCIFNLKDFKKSLMITVLLIFIYKFLMIWWYEIVSLSITNMDMKRNIMIIICNLVVGSMVNVCKIDVIKGIVNRHLKLIGVCLVTFLVHHLIVSMMFGEFSFSLYELMNICGDDQEKFLISFYWIIPRFLFYIYCLSRFTNYYKDNFILFAVRIKNRGKWFLLVLSKIMRDALFFSSIDIIYELIRKGIDLVLIKGFIINYLNLMMMIIILICFSIIFSDLSITQSVLYIYIGLIFIHCYFDTPIKHLLYNNMSINNVVIMCLCIFICIKICIWLLNNKEYYM